jgi:hypothetical protein
MVELSKSAFEKPYSYIMDIARPLEVALCKADPFEVLPRKNLSLVS